MGELQDSPSPCGSERVQGLTPHCNKCNLLMGFYPRTPRAAARDQNAQGPLRANNNYSTPGWWYNLGFGCHAHGFAWACGDSAIQPCPRKAVGMAPKLYQHSPLPNVD